MSGKGRSMPHLLNEIQPHVPVLHIAPVENYTHHPNFPLREGGVPTASRCHAGTFSIRRREGGAESSLASRAVDPSNVTIVSCTW